MKVLFIGGTGNISTACASALYERGHEIAVVTRGGSCVPNNYRRIVADRKDAESLRAVRSWGADVVLNFLGYELIDVQVDFDLFRERVRQYVFISSATVYAKPPPRLPITEASPLGNPFWDYAQKKHACEQWLLERWQTEGFPVTIVRPSHTYSERWVPNPLSSSSFTFCLRLQQGKPVFVPDDGEGLWTLTASSDFAKGLAGLIGHPSAAGEAFHITSDEVLTWNQIVREIASAVGVERPHVVRVPTDLICAIAPQMTGSLKGDKAHPGVFDNSKIKRFVTGFVCTKPFAAGVRESVRWLTNHPESQNPSAAADEICEKVCVAA